MGIISGVAAGTYMYMYITLAGGHRWLLYGSGHWDMFHCMN